MPSSCARSASAGSPVATLLWDGRYSLMTAALAGFGRAIAEVGAVIIVGGNINHVTRVMTTTIALETSQGNLALALALGLILVALAVAGERRRAGPAAHGRRPPMPEAARRLVLVEPAPPPERSILPLEARQLGLRGRRARG